MIATAAVLIAAAPLRQLVYSFTVGINDSTRDSSMSNHDAYENGQTSDMGTITVDVTGVEGDGGLVLSVAESGRNGRSVSPTECVVYANTNIMCGSVQLAPEESAVLRTLNPKFLDLSTLDDKNHWHIAPPGSGVTIDYSAAKGPTASTVAITGTRDEKSSQTMIHSEMTYTYDASTVVPTQVQEYETIHADQGARNSTTTIDVTAKLTSDSGVKH